MFKRYNCLFKNCKCNGFERHCNNLCKSCKHADVWHSDINSLHVMVIYLCFS